MAVSGHLADDISQAYNLSANRCKLTPRRLLGHRGRIGFMDPVKSFLRLHGNPHPIRTGAVAALILFFVLAVRSAQTPAHSNGGEVSPPASAAKDQPAPSLPSQTGGGKKAGLDKTKADVEQLSALADQLRDQLDKLNPNVLSIGILEKTQTIEKLARQIREEA